MSERVKIVSEQVLAKNWGELRRTSFDFRRRDGQWERQVRETYDHGSAAAVLLYDPAHQKVTLVRQFRFPVYLQGEDAFLLEVTAGLLDGDAPERCARREAEEEAGIRPGRLHHAFETYVSPGSITERISCYVGIYAPADRLSKGGGLAEEGEDIEVVEMGFDAALGLIVSGGITDAKTIMLLQYLALNPIAP